MKIYEYPIYTYHSTLARTYKDTQCQTAANAIYSTKMMIYFAESQ